MNDLVVFIICYTDIWYFFIQVLLPKYIHYGIMHSFVISYKLCSKNSILIKGAVKIKYKDQSDKAIEVIAGTWLAKAKERKKK